MISEPVTEACDESLALAVTLARLRMLTASGEARRIREDANLSQPEAAEAVQVAQSTMSLWERGRRVPHGEPAVRYAALLDRLQAIGQEERT